jgi:iron complex transport system substrate-binding protein
MEIKPMKCGAAVMIPLLIIAVIGCSKPQSETPTKDETRIVSLAPNVTEILFALGLMDSIVGVTQFCNYPAKAKELPKIGGYIDPDIERILSLHPTMVIGIGEVEPHKTVCDKLSSKNIKTVLVREKDIASLYEAIKTIGTACGVAERAERLITEIKKRLDDIRERASEKKKQRALFLCGVDPLVAVGTTSFINELMRICGAENVITEARDYLPIDIERVVAGKPNVIIQITMGTEKISDDFWQRYAELIPAVKSNRIVSVDADLFTRCGPRIPDACEELFKALHK